MVPPDLILEQVGLAWSKLSEQGAGSGQADEVRSDIPLRSQIDVKISPLNIDRDHLPPELVRRRHCKTEITVKSFADAPCGDGL